MSNNKKKDPLAIVLEDIAKRIATIEKDVRRLEEVNIILITNYRDLISIVKSMAVKMLGKENNNKKKNGKKIQRNDDLENLYR